LSCPFGALLLGAPSLASASTFTVNHAGDAPDLGVGNGTCSVFPGSGVCTLRAAVMEANATPGPDTICFDAGITTIVMTVAGRNEGDAATGD